MVIEDGLPDMVDDVSSYDGDDSHDGDYVCDEDIDNDDGLCCLDVQSSVHEATLLTAYMMLVACSLIKSQRKRVSSKNYFSVVSPFMHSV